MVIETHSPQETESLGRELAGGYADKVCIALRGDLGAGKTTLVRGLVAGWGGDVSQVSSPTYVLMNCYASPRGSIFHLDAYRVHGPDDFDAIGFNEIVDQPGMVIVEWPQRVTDLLPKGTIEIEIEAVGKTVRRLTIEKNQAKIR